MADIFISYAREDEVRIQPLVRVLENRAWSIFWDRHIPAGQTWRSYIGKALGDARCVIVAWSRDSIVSDWVSEEADEGKKRGILIPVLLDAVEPPIGFRSIQAADLTDWQSDRLSPHFEKLLREIGGVLHATPTPTPKTGPSKGRKFPLLGILLLVALVVGGTIAIRICSRPPPTPPTAKSTPLATPESAPTTQKGDKANQTASVQPPSSEYPKPGTSTPTSTPASRRTWSIRREEGPGRPHVEGRRPGRPGVVFSSRTGTRYTIWYDEGDGDAVGIDNSNARSPQQRNLIPLAKGTSSEYTIESGNNLGIYLRQRATYAKGHIEEHQ